MRKKYPGSESYRIRGAAEQVPRQRRKGATKRFPYRRRSAGRRGWRRCRRGPPLPPSLRHPGAGARGLHHRRARCSATIAGTSRARAGGRSLTYASGPRTFCSSRSNSGAIPPITILGASMCRRAFAKSARASRILLLGRLAMGQIETANTDPAAPCQLVIAAAGFVFGRRPAVHRAEQVHQLQRAPDGDRGIRPRLAAFLSLLDFNGLPPRHHAAQTLWIFRRGGLKEALHVHGSLPWARLRVARRSEDRLLAREVAGDQWLPGTPCDGTEGQPRDAGASALCPALPLPPCARPGDRRPRCRAGTKRAGPASGHPFRRPDGTASHEPAP
jgi:hypothetical protein